MSNPPLQSRSLLPESNMWGKRTTKLAKPAHSLDQKEAATVSMVSGKDIFFRMALEGAHIPWQQSLLLSSAVIKNHLSLSPYQALIKGSNDPQAEKCNQDPAPGNCYQFAHTGWEMAEHFHPPARPRQNFQWLLSLYCMVAPRAREKSCLQALSTAQLPVLS